MRVFLETKANSGSVSRQAACITLITAICTVHIPTEGGYSEVCSISRGPPFVYIQLVDYFLTQIGRFYCQCGRIGIALQAEVPNKCQQVVLELYNDQFSLYETGLKIGRKGGWIQDSSGGKFYKLTQH